MSLEPDHRYVLVLGIGNILWADEGFGVRAVEALNAAYRCGPEVRILDGGTQGIFLLPHVRAASHLLLFDAVDFGLRPGALCLFRDADVPHYMGAKKVSMHQTGFQEVLAAAALLGESPRELALIGVQPAELDDYGGSLRPRVRARIPQAVRLAVSVLRRWGVPVAERREPGAATGPAATALGAYEAGRPVC